MSDTENQETGTTETPSIEAIAAEYKLSEPQEPASTPDPQPPKAAAVTTVPDPVTDTDGYKAWARQQAEQVAELRTTLQQTQDQRAAESQQLQAQQEEQEINALVDKVHGEIGGVPKKLVKYALADRYASDPAFKAIFDGRAKTPQALEKAIHALVPEFRKEFAVKADPQIAENQRAMSDGTRGSNSPRSDADSKDLEMLRSDPSSFEQYWHKLKAGM